MELTQPADLAVKQAKKSTEHYDGHYSNNGRGSQDSFDNHVDGLIRCRIESCPYAFMFDRVRWQYDRGTLTLDGAVQSFYLREMLVQLVRKVEHVDRIVNRVDVINPTGLSSVRHTGEPDGQPGAVRQRQPRV